MPNLIQTQTPSLTEKNEMEFRIRKFADEGNYEELKRLLDIPNFKEYYDIDAVGANTGHSALHRAAIKGHVAVIDLLLEHGADLTVQTKIGETATYLAGLHGQRSAWDRLIKAETKAFPSLSKSDQYAFFMGSNLGAFRKGLTKFNCNYFAKEIIEAVITETDEALKKEKIRILIVEFGFNINNCHRRNYANSMIYTFLMNETPCKEIALEAIKLTAGLRGNKKLNPNLKDVIRYGRTILMLAIAMDYLEIVEFLLTQRESLNLDINMQDNQGYTALHYACIFRNTQAITLLLEAGAVQMLFDEQFRIPQQLLEKKHQDELSRIMLTLNLNGNRDVNAKTNCLETKDQHFILKKDKFFYEHLKLLPLKSNILVLGNFIDWFTKAHSVIATKENLKECIYDYTKFTSMAGIFYKDPLALCTKEQHEYLSEMEKQFFGRSLKEHLLSKTEEARKLFAQTASTASSTSNADTLTAAGLFRGATAVPSRAALQAQAEQKTPN